MSYWDPRDYTIENQISDIMGGKDVITTDDECIMKGDDSHIDIYWPSDSKKGHGHGGAECEDSGFSNIKPYHD